MPYKRTDRVNALLQRVLAQLISEELSDPRIPFATVTDVDVTADLKTARVHVSFLGDEEQGREAMRALDGAKPYLRRELGERTELRTVPDLVFVEDRSAARAARITALLREAKERSSEDPAPPVRASPQAAERAARPKAEREEQAKEGRE